MAQKREKKGMFLFFFLLAISQYIGWRLQRDGDIRWTLWSVLALVLGGMLAAVAASWAFLWMEGLIGRKRAE
ncbi:MAG: hypothetical protein K2H12_04790, partial [Acetatifactor sp.]|nr:hypothetical protein [Acetatifactor sp.]